MTTARPLSNSLSLRRVTLLLGLVVAGFIPVMQLIVDQTWPQVSKPVIAGVLCGLLIACLCCLPRRWNLRFFVLICAGLCTLGLAEVACRVLLASGTESIYEWSDQALYLPRPNSRKTYRRTAINGGQTSEVVINSLGYRGPELPANSAESRVVIYGDSFIEAEYSRWENTFGEQLRQRATKSLGRPVTVINAGVNGYGPDQALMRMETELPQIRPQLVILAVFADNDYGDLLRNKRFRLNEQGELISNAWKRAADCQHPGMHGRYEPTLWRLARNTIRGIQSRGGMVESYMEHWRQQCVTEYDEYIVRGDSEVHDLQVDHYDADMSLTPDVPSATYKARFFGRVLERIAATCERNKAQLLVVIIPSPADLIENYDFCAIDHALYPCYDPRRLTAVAADATRHQKLKSVNLFDSFTQHGASKLYFRGGNNHWNDDGQRVAAEVVAPEVVELLSAP